MDVYLYSAALYCADCGEKIRADLTAKGKAPEGPDDEHTYDSDAFPKGPYADGGGEADTPQHCDGCGVFLENPLTSDGEVYVCEAVVEALSQILEGKPPADSVAWSAAWSEWRPFYGVQISAHCGDATENL